VLTRTNFRAIVLQHECQIKKWFVEIVEILKIISYEPAYHGIKAQNVWKKEYTAMFKFFVC